MAIYDGFYDARTARDIAIGGKATNSIVLLEINALQVLIDTQAGLNQLMVQITNETAMTMGEVYYLAWSDTSDATATTDPDKALRRLARARMDAIIGYLTRLGYQITRTREGVSNRIQWVIRW